MKNFEINNFDEFLGLIQEIKDENNDEILVFRGQRKDLPLTASQNRNKIDHLQIEARYRFAFLLFNTFDIDLDPQNLLHRTLIGALNQHYGWHSKLLDVTLDPLIALWFAVNKNTSTSKTGMYEDAYEVPYLKIENLSNYEQSNEEFGFVYIIKVPPFWNEENHFHFVDLTKEFPDSAKRIHSQSGASLEDITCDYKTKNALSINDLIIAKIKVKVNGVIDKINSDFSMHDLFPNEQEDQFYSKHLYIPHVIDRTNFMGIDILLPLFEVPIFRNIVTNQHSYGSNIPVFYENSLNRLKYWFIKK
jgi:hypothetical protein